MKKNIKIGIGIGVFILLILIFIPFKTYWVDDKWVYGVKDMREIFPEANYDGQKVGNGITIFSVSSSQTKRLNVWQYLSAKKSGALR